MKPQTYNNFIGSQGSKPNVELIVGIVNKFGVNPMWLLNGIGSIFQDEEKGQAALGNSAHPGAAAYGIRAVNDIAIAFPSSEGPIDVEALKEEIRTMEPLLQKVETQIKELEFHHIPIVDRYIGVIKRYYELDPISAIEEFRDMLKRIEDRMANK